MKTLPNFIITDKLRDRFLRKVDKSGGENACWVWMACKDKLGYGRMSSRKGCSPFKAHRVAWEIEVGPIPNETHVLHKCDNPSCCNPSHLFLGTHRDNMDDMVKKGRAKSLMKIHSKLTADEVKEIIARKKSGERADCLAMEFSITKQHVNRIVRGQSWGGEINGRF